jgi:hypothetical protein
MAFRIQIPQGAAAPLTARSDQVAMLLEVSVFVEPGEEVSHKSMEVARTRSRIER